MGAQWMAALGWLCLMAAVANSLAVPTPDTMVVARSDDDHSESSTSSPSVTESELTTEEAAPPVKLTEMTVTSNVALRYAHTAVVTHVRNPAKKAQEATFRVLLPETAFISGFVMTLNGKSYKAYVKEKEEAKQIYNQAVSQGLGAAHIAAKARDSNHFTVSVNVEPNTAAIFNLTYEELLVRRNGVYNHAINLHPGALVPNLTVTVNIHETEKITVLRVPEVRTGNEIDATAEDPQNGQAVIERGHDDRVASVTFKPDLEEQRRLIAVYMEKTKESRASSRNFRYGYVSEEQSPPESDGTLGQFVVQYDVDRPKNGEILVNDGYFVHFFAPTDLPPLNKHVVFVLDTSGSMMDRKIVQLREAMQTILSDLNAGDYFSIVEFASSVIVHELKEADLEPKKPNYSYGFEWEAKTAPKLVPPSPATPENIAKAKVIVSRLDAAGGTNIGDALDVAVQIIKKGIYSEADASPAPPKEKLPMAVPLATDDVTTEKATTEKPTEPSTTKATEPSTTKATELADKAIKLEPIIIFLTDGDPTVGETNPTKIINHLTEKNYGDNKATIFSLAFGEDADRKFLRKISLRNDGFMRHIYEASDAALQLRDFYRQVSSPLLADVHFSYPPDQVQTDSLTKSKFRTYYAGSETVVAGRIRDGATELAPRLTGYQAEGDAAGKKRKRYEVVSRKPVDHNKESYFPLERLWAYLTVRQLLDEKDAQLDTEQTTDKDKSPEKKALAISLKYELVTPLTSLVVVKPNATDAVNAESVDKDNNNPYALPGAAGVPLAAHFSSANILSRPAAAPAQFSGLSGPAAFPNGHGLRLRTASYTRPYFYSAPGLGPSFQTMSSSSMDFPGSQLQLISGDIPEEPTTASPVAMSTPLLLMSTTKKPLSPLVQFNLQAYQWAEPLISISEKALVFEVNNNTQKLLLTESGTEPLDDDADVPCTSEVGGPGLCVYLTRCGAAKNITSEAYKTTFCRVDGFFAGVCCPQDTVTNARVKKEKKLAGENSSDKPSSNPKKEAKATSNQA